MAKKRDTGQWILPPPVGILVGWATGASAGAPPPAAWSLAGIAAWCSVPYNLSFVVIGAVAGVGTFVGFRKWLARSEGRALGFDSARPDAVTDRLDQIIKLLGHQALSPALAEEAAALAVNSLPGDGGTDQPLIASFAETIAAVSQSANPKAREAIALELGGNRDEAYDQLMALGEREAGMSAERFRQAAALAAPTDVGKAIRAYARAADIEPDNVWTWIELRRLHEAAGSVAAARRSGERAEQYAKDPRDIAVVQNELGSVALAEGQLEKAKLRFLRAFDATEDLLSRNTDDSVLQYDLSVSHNRLGEVALAGRHFEEAQKQYEAGLAIRKRLADSDPANAEWQNGVAVSHNSLGVVMEAQGHLDKARECYAAGLEIRERLAAVDPENTKYRRNLSVSLNNLGDVAVAMDDLDKARQWYLRDLSIAEQLAESDGSNAGWQRDLSISHEKLGDVARKAEDLPRAREHYEKNLAIRKALVETDSANASWQRDLFVGYDRMGRITDAEGDRIGAIIQIEEAKRVIEVLVRKLPDHPGFKRDLEGIESYIAHLCSRNH